MKILLLITGQIREDYVRTYESLNDEILSKYDCDMIVTPLIDNIFDENIDKVLKSDYPLFAKHPHNPFNKKSTLNLIKTFTNKKPKMNYVFASFLYSKNNIWFLKEVYDEMNRIGNIIGEDEIVINSLLTKYEVDYDIGYNYLPNGNDNMIGIYFNEVENNISVNTYLANNCDLRFYIFHSHKIKNSHYTKDLINKLKNSI